MASLSDFVIGPLDDLRRFVLGFGPPPRTRQTAAARLAAARATLEGAGCDLEGCSCENLHIARAPLDADDVYSQFERWQAWPRSGFLPRPRMGSDGARRFSYRFYGLLPVVDMRLQSAVRPCHVIHAVTWGFGHGGYHCFLFRPAGVEATEVSIYTVYPPQFFLTGLHDQTNRDIFRMLGAVANGV